MADYNEGCQTNDGFKEAVCISGNRVFDSCCDRDCLEDLRCYFTATTQTLVEQAISVRIKNAQVLNVAIQIEPVNFNRGYYSCDLTFFFNVTLDLYTAANACPTTVSGICCYNKKVILFGSEGNVKTFSNELGATNCDSSSTVIAGNNTPVCTVQCVDPVALSARLGRVRESYCNNCMPNNLRDYTDCALVTDSPVGTPTVYVTLGLFTIVELTRNVQMLIPVYDYCIPEKHCCGDTADLPCDIFNKIKFPTDDFFPPKPEDINGCGCC